MNPSPVFELSACDMIEVPSVAFTKCKYLRKTILDLSQNRLRDLGPNIDALACLEELDLSKNNFKSLQPDISKLKNLRVLKLSGNLKFDDVSSILSLVLLEELHIDGTSIKATQCH